MLLNKSLLISVCFVVICIFFPSPRLKYGPETKMQFILLRCYLRSKEEFRLCKKIKLQLVQIAVLPECPGCGCNREQMRETRTWLWRTPLASHQPRASGVRALLVGVKSALPQECLLLGLLIIFQHNLRFSPI